MLSVLVITIIVAALLSSYISSVYCRNVTVFRCCLSHNNNFEETPLIISNAFGFNATETKQLRQFGNIDIASENLTISANLCSNNEVQLSSDFTLDPHHPNALILGNGYLQIDRTQFTPTQFCISRFNSSSITVKVSHLVTENESVPIRKCCGPTEVFDLSTFGVSKLLCVSSIGKPWKPTIYPVYQDHAKTGLGNHSRIHLISDHPTNWCEEEDSKVVYSQRDIRNNRKSLFRILDDGSVVKREGTTWKIMNSSKICVDGSINNPGYLDLTNKESYNDELDTIIIECGPELAKMTEAPVFLYLIALIVSSIASLATVIIYGLLWEKQNIHGWTLMGYVTSMMLLYTSLLTTKLHVHYYPDSNFLFESEVILSFCGIIAIISHFFYICTMCWLTVISFDIFSKFRILKLTGVRSKNRLKFLFYLMFTIIVPLIIVTIGVLLDVKYGDDLEVNLILPLYGWNKCFLNLENAALPYLFGPIGVLLLINCALYLATIFHMHKLQESTKFASTNSSQVRKHRAKIRLFSKLFLLMGLNWIFGVASFLIFGVESNVFVVIIDMINILQPVVVFIVFVCKRDILESLCQKYSSLSKICLSAEPEDSNTSSSSERNPWIWPSSTPARWFRARINSTMTDTSNISNLSVSRSTIEAQTPTPSPLPPRIPLEQMSETETK